MRRTTCIRSPTTSSSPRRARASSRAPRASTSTRREGDKILDGMSGLWCVALGYGRQELSERRLQADARAAVLQQLLPVHDAAGHRARAHPEGSDAAAVQSRFLHGLGQRGERHAAPAGAPLLAAARISPSATSIISRWNGYHGSTIAGASLGGMKPMHEQLGPDGALPGIVHINQPYWFGEGGDLTPAEFGLALRARARSEDPGGRPAPRRRVHRRAGAGRRRPGHPAGDLLAGNPAHRRQVRNPVRLRRGDLRLRPHRASGSAANTTARARTS